MEFMERTFFYDKNNHKDEEVAISGNCFDQLCCIIYKNNNNDLLINIEDLWLNDLTYTIKEKNGCLIRSSIKNKVSSVDKNLYNISSIVIQGDELLASELISRQLSENGMVIFRTVDKMLPISKYYDPLFNNWKEFPENGHFMLMVGEDSNYYYFVDQMSEINEKYISTVGTRKDIFKWNKKEMQSLFGIYLKILTVKFIMTDYMDLKRKNEQIILESVNCFFDDSLLNGAECETEIVTLKNIQALVWLNAFCNSGNKLDMEVYRYPQGVRTSGNVYNEIVNGITGIVNNRILLYRFLAKNSLADKFLIDCLKKNIYKWKNLKLYFMKSYYEKEYDLDGRYGFCFDSVIDAETVLFMELRKIRFTSQVYKGV